MDTLERLATVALAGSFIAAVIIIVAWAAWDFVRAHGIVMLLLALILAGFVGLLFAGYGGFFGR
jgi:hypothetical protein